MQQVKKFKDLPWENSTYEDPWYASYDAIEPKCAGHKIYVPKDNSPVCLNATFLAAYSVGNMLLGNKIIDAFKIVMEIGEGAGQTIGWPHIHLLPYKNEDIAEDS